SRVDTDQAVDVEWSPDIQGVFEAGIRLLVSDKRGLLASLATAIADADANIAYVSMERPDEGLVVNMFFSVQVRDRKHLADVIRGLYRVPEVRRVQRARTCEPAGPAASPGFHIAAGSATCRGTCPGIRPLDSSLTCWDPSPIYVRKQLIYRSFLP